MNTFMKTLSIFFSFVLLMGCAVTPVTVASSDTGVQSGTNQKSESSDTDVVLTRKQIAMFSEEQEQLFLSNVSIREKANARDQILTSILQEKVQLRDQVVAKLRDDFQFETDESLAFSKEENALLKRVEGQEDVRVHTFTSDEERNRFARLLNLSRNIGQQINLLNGLIKEQDVVVGRVNQNLKRLFNVHPEKRYHYDNQNRVLFLLEPASS
jgi:hypothetical protein